MQITVNGRVRELAAATSVAALLQALDLDAARVAIELNLEILPRDRFEDRLLADGDTLEIVQFVGGG